METPWSHVRLREDEAVQGKGVRPRILEFTPPGWFWH